MLLLLRREHRDLGTSQGRVGDTGYPAPMEVNEKQLGVPSPQSGWSRIQVGMGQKQGKRGGEGERGNSAWIGETGEGGAQCGAQCHNQWGHKGLNFGVTKPQN